jgi:TatD DNase family protein
VFIDIHTHNKLTKNPLSVLSTCISAARELLEANTTNYISVGIHPWEVHQTNSGIFEELITLASDKRVVAIGECGIDKNSRASIKEQDYFFERQIQISETLQKPLIIHCVAAFNEIVALKKRIKPKQLWIIHGFRGKPQLAQQLLSQGLILSYGEKFNPLSVAITPLDKLCVETDESSLPIENIYLNIAAIKNCLPQEINAASKILSIYYC